MGMTRPDTGTIRADDGWRLEWDITELPHRVDKFDAEGGHKLRTSGDVTQRHLQYMIRHFLREHAGQQMVMEW